MLWLLLGLNIFLLFSLLFIIESLNAYSNRISALSTDFTKKDLLIPKTRLLRKLGRSNTRFIEKNSQMYQFQMHQAQEINQVLNNLNEQMKAPLTVANGYAEVLHSLLQDHVQLEMVEKVEQNLYDLGRRIDFQTEYNALIEKKLHLSNVSINLSQILKNDISTYFDAMDRAGFSFDIHIEEGCRIRGDREVLQRMLSRLLENVLRHGERFFSVQLTSGNHKCMLELSNGIGDCVENKDVLEEMFTHSDFSRIEKIDGLGLVIASQLAELLEAEKLLTVETGAFSVSLVFEAMEE